MAAILCEDTIQRDLREKGQYTGSVAVTEQAVLAFDSKWHISYATRRSPYFAHTRKGKRDAARPVVRVNVGLNWWGKA